MYVKIGFLVRAGIYLCDDISLSISCYVSKCNICARVSACRRMLKFADEISAEI